MADKFKCGVIGLLGRGKYWMNQIRGNKRAELTALCDINELLLGRFAEEYGVEKKYTSYVDLCENEDLDVVCIATPHYLHAPMTVVAAENDINVMLEKPMAITLRQCDSMIMAARKNCVKLGIGYQMRNNPVFPYLRDAVNGAEGELGGLGRITDISMVARHFRSEFYYLNSSAVDPKTGVAPGPWRGRWETEGGGILLNQAIHNVDAYRYVTGPVRRLTAYGKTISKEHKFIEVEDTISVNLELENGAFGNVIITSSNKKAVNNHIHVHGTEGYIEASTGFVADYITFDSRYEDEEDYEVPLPQQDQFNDFLDAIEEDKEPRINGEEGRKAIEFVRAIIKSIQTGREVLFPFHDSQDFPALYNLNREEPPEF